MTPQLPPSKLYTDYVFDGKKTALQFWGPIPRNIKEAISLSSPLIRAYREKQPLFSLERMKTLCDVIRETHQAVNMLTPQVQDQLHKFEEQGAVIEAGHQPALLGGPGFVINKIAAISKIASLTNATPIMFVGDHDQEQKELTVVHLPSPGPRGLTFSLPINREYRMSPMHLLPLPSKNWLKPVIEKVSSTYHELVASSAKNKLNLYEERATIIAKIIEQTFNQARTIADWTIRLWMQIINQSQDSGVLFHVFSNPLVRELMLPAFEYLLTEPNRQKFIQALNQSAEKLEHLGYEPGIGRRTPDYVPFHLECPTKGCHRTRLDPTLSLNTKKTQTTISATCPKCKNTHQLEINSTNPDLTEWKLYLSPRVDTRAFLVQSYTPVILHVGGAGETSYHAQVSPALQANNSIVPIFFRYTRLYYENPWTNRTAQRLIKEQLIPLSHNELKRFESAIKTGYAEENSGVVHSVFAASEEHIMETAERLIKVETQLEDERRGIILQQREIADSIQKKESQIQIGVLTRRRQVLQTYLSQMFGRYSVERLGQEVSFIWIDASMSMDPRLHFGRLCNYYQEYTPAAATAYLTDLPFQN